jgi:hypothetical protein
VARVRVDVELMNYGDPEMGGGAWDVHVTIEHEGVRMILRPISIEAEPFVTKPEVCRLLEELQHRANDYGSRESPKVDRIIGSARGDVDLPDPDL